MEKVTEFERTKKLIEPYRDEVWTPGIAKIPGIFGSKRQIYVVAPTNKEAIAMTGVVGAGDDEKSKGISKAIAALHNNASALFAVVDAANKYCYGNTKCRYCHGTRQATEYVEKRTNPLYELYDALAELDKEA